MRTEDLDHKDSGEPSDQAVLDSADIQHDLEVRFM